MNKYFLGNFRFSCVFDEQNFDSIQQIVEVTSDGETRQNH